MFAEYYFLGLLLAASSLISGYMFIAAQVPPGLKVALSAIMVFLSIWQWQILKTDILGFPVHSQVPDHSILVNFTSNPKWIYMWVTAGVDGEPRAYAVPFSKALYDKLKYAWSHQHGGPIAVTHGIDDSDSMDDYDLKEQNNLPPKGPAQEENDQ